MEEKQEVTDSFKCVEGCLEVLAGCWPNTFPKVLLLTAIRKWTNREKNSRKVERIEIYPYALSVYARLFYPFTFQIFGWMQYQFNQESLNLRCILEEIRKQSDLAVINNTLLLPMALL